MPGDDKYPGGGPATIGGVPVDRPLSDTARCAGFGGNRYDMGRGSLMNLIQP
jgi:hypothetical protein